MEKPSRPPATTRANRIPEFLLKEKPELIEGQALAELVGLPRHCINRKCRRSRQCLGTDVRCHLDQVPAGVWRWRALDPDWREAELQRRIREKAAQLARHSPGLNAGPVPGPLVNSRNSGKSRGCRQEFAT